MTAPTNIPPDDPAIHARLAALTAEQREIAAHVASEHLSKEGRHLGSSPLWRRSVWELACEQAETPVVLPSPEGESVGCPAAPSKCGWPDPLGKAALHGLAGEFVRLVSPHSEADEAALLAQFLIAFGSVVGRGPHAEAEDDEHHANEFVAIVGETAKGRKGTAYGRVRRVLAQVDPQWAATRVMGGLSSGEGLIWNVRDPDGDDDGEPDKRLLAVETEMASVLQVMQRKGNTVSAIMRQAWDHGGISQLTKNCPAKATNAHVSIIGHITREELRRHLTATEAGNGFANRFLWVCSRRSKLLPEGGGKPDMQGLVAGLQNAVESARRAGNVIVKMDGEALPRWREAYRGCLAESAPGLLGAVTTRAEPHVLRLSLIYALLDASTVIRRPHLDAGLEVWRYAFDSARHIFGAGTGDPVADRAEQVIRDRPGITTTEISNAFGRNKDAATIRAALAGLVGFGRIHSTKSKTGGRDAERWYPGAGGSEAGHD